MTTTRRDFLTAAAAIVAFLFLSGVARANNCSGTLVYLSSKDKTYGYLEAKQRQIYQTNPDLVDPFSREELSKPSEVKSWDDLVKRLEKVGCSDAGTNCVGDPALAASIRQFIDCQPLPTRFESPLAFYLIHLHMKPLEEVRQAEYPETEEVRFGTLPTGTVDAETVKVPETGKNLVIVNRDIFEFTGVFSKSVAAAVPILPSEHGTGFSSSTEKIHQRLRENPEIVTDFVEAMLLLVRSGTPAGASEVALDDNHSRLYGRLLDGMDSFIVAHETAHAILHHTDGQLRSLRLGGMTLSSGNYVAPRNQSHKNDTITVLDHTKAQEFAADDLGLRLYVKTFRSDDNWVDLTIAAAGADMFFGIVDLADRYARQYGGYIMTDSSHPSALERSSALDNVYRDIATRTPKSNGLRDFRTVTRASFAVLAQEADPLIRAALVKQTSPTVGGDSGQQ
jgi:hypothetical protein